MPSRRGATRGLTAMSHLIAMVFKWLLDKLGLLVVILAILLVGAWLKAEWDTAPGGAGGARATGDRARRPAGDLQSIEVAIAADQAEWRRATAERMRALWDELERPQRPDRRPTRDDSQAARGKYLDLARQAQAARRAANQAKVKLDVLERGYWWWDTLRQPHQARRAAGRARDLCRAQPYRDRRRGRSRPRVTGRRGDPPRHRGTCRRARGCCCRRSRIPTRRESPR